MKRTLRSGLVLLAIVFVTVIESRAQEWVPLRWSFVASSEAADPIHAIGERPGVSVSHLSIGAAVPARMADGQLVNGLRYQRLDFGYDRGTMAAPAPATLHYLRYDLTFIWQGAAGWSMRGYLAPGLATDFSRRIGEADVHIRTAVLFARCVSPSLTYGLGVTYRNRLDNGWLPVAQFRMAVGPHLRVDVLAPSRAQLWIAPRRHRTLEVGLQVHLLTLPFHLARGEEGHVQRMQYRRFTGALAAQLRLAGSVHVSLAGGLTMRHEMTFEQRLVQRMVALDSGLFIEAALRLKTDF